VRHIARFAVTLPAVFLLISNAAFTQRGPGGVANPGRFEIRGNVTDDDRHSPIQDAQVRLSTSAGEMMSSAYSNDRGEFSFINIPAGFYTLAVSANGFESGNQDLSIVGTSVENLHITLRKTTETNQDGATKSDIVSARELSLPSKAQEAWAKGKDRLYQKHDPAGSLPFFRKVNELAPGFYEAYYEEGVAFTLQGQPGDAESAFRKAIATSKYQYADPCFAVASLLTDEKQFEDAERFARRGIELEPDAWRGYYELARALLGEGKLNDAEKNGMEARKRKEDFAGLYLILANIHLQLHNNEAVLDDVNAFLKLDPSGPNSNQARAIKSQMEHALGKQPGPGSPQPPEVQ
jgi:tetratricopeptide (TPR) repeat protein